MYIKIITFSYFIMCVKGTKNTQILKDKDKLAITRYFNTIYFVQETPRSALRTRKPSTRRSRSNETQTTTRHWRTIPRIFHFNFADLCARICRNVVEMLKRGLWWKSYNSRETRENKNVYIIEQSLNYVFSISSDALKMFPLWKYIVILPNTLGKYSGNENYGVQVFM